MTYQSQFVGFGVQVELKDGKLIQGNIGKATAKGLTLYDVTFGDGGTSQAFKVRSSRLKDLKVLSVATNKNQKRDKSNSNNNNNSNNIGINSSNANNTKKNKSNNNNNADKADRIESGINTNNVGDWQNDDVVKIKEQEDFDFQHNLSMFNKKDIFAQLKQQDEIDPSKRLVYHNKKKSDKINDNYDIDQMVIPNAKDDSWHTINNSASIKEENIKGFGSNLNNTTTTINSNSRPLNKYANEEGEDEDNDDEFESAESEVNSNSDGSNYLPITKSINITHLLHSAVNSNNNRTESNNKKSTNKKDKDQDGNSMNNKTNNNEDEILSKLQSMIMKQSTQNGSRQSSISFNPTIINSKTKKHIPMATPVQLLEIERLSQENCGITINSMNDIFAINASYYIRQKLGGSARLTYDNINPEPLVIILASDSNRSGNKALILGKYLCQQVRVLTLFTSNLNNNDNNSGNNDNEEFNESLFENIEIYKACGGKIANNLTQLKNLLKKLNSPVELIIDAMQGFDCNLIDFDTNQDRIIEIIDWCNNIIHTSNAKICSIDMPAGYDSGSGLQNFEVAIEKVHYILCSYTWPLISLNTLRDIINHNNHNNEENVIMIDCGVPRLVYSQKSSLRKFYNVDTFTNGGNICLTI